MKVLDLAEYVIRRAVETDMTITNLKLQKTLYYLQGYSLKRLNTVAFDEDIQNWQYGPVSPVAYFQYCSYGAHPLEENGAIEIETIERRAKQLFDKVIDACLALPARQLVQKSHEEDPWRNTNLNEVITVESIKKYFRSHDPLGISTSEDS